MELRQISAHPKLLFQLGFERRLAGIFEVVDPVPGFLHVRHDGSRQGLDRCTSSIPRSSSTLCHCEQQKCGMDEVQRSDDRITDGSICLTLHSEIPKHTHKTQHDARIDYTNQDHMRRPVNYVCFAVSSWRISVLPGGLLHDAPSYAQRDENGTKR